MPGARPVRANPKPDRPRVHGGAATPMYQATGCAL